MSQLKIADGGGPESGDRSTGGGHEGGLPHCQKTIHIMIITLCVTSGSYKKKKNARRLGTLPRERALEETKCKHLYSKTVRSHH